MITYEQTLADLRKIAEEKKAANDGRDYVYEFQYDGREPSSWPRCLYTHKAPDGALSPGCIIGALFATVHGVTPERLETLQFDVGDGRAVMVADMLELDFNREARALLTDVQFAQDSGVPWCAAVEMAVRQHDDRLVDAS